jgi:uncharacterized protein YggE
MVDVMAKERTITVSAVGKAAAVPDVVTVAVSVQVRAGGAQDALAQTKAKTTAAVAAFKEGGVADRDVATTNITIWPEYGEDRRRVEGYRAENSLSVRLRDVGRAGGLLDTVAGIVGDDIVIQGISFAVAEPEVVQAEARAAAMDTARTKADQLAHAAGTMVGEVVQIVEGASSGPTAVAMAGRQAAFDSMPVEPGEHELAVAVTVTYRLEDRHKPR